ncbi:MAG TPA: hypothetical protein VLD57_02410 [Blastocatellia bacterium]|nr:hypothetical protein [Blastocatellia bacterium]
MKQAPSENEPARLASEFWRRFHETREYPRETIGHLIGLALSEDEETSKQASRAIFTAIIERLADSFDPDTILIYNRLLAQLIDRFGRTETGLEIIRALVSFGLRGEEALFQRAENLRRAQRLHLGSHSARSVRRVTVLSRVTIGADVAISSVIIERLKREFPDAGITLVGGGKAIELFGGDPHLSFKEIAYRRAGTVAERLLSWLDVLALVREMTQDAQLGESLIVDPDSRLTQLGLLPVAPADNYLFFPSREYGADRNLSLARLASEWMDEVFGSEPRSILPRLSLSRGDIDIASEIQRRMKGESERPVVTVNFGVGGNESKRVGDHFERALIAALLAKGAKVILDKGSSEEEAARAGDAINYTLAANRDARAVEADEDRLELLLKGDYLSGADLLSFRGRVGLLGAMIGISDLYIGYDSAGQHIAAALGVACIDIFAGYTSPRMLDRWRPAGPAPVKVIAVDTLSRPADQERVLAETLSLAF